MNNMKVDYSKLEEDILRPITQTGRDFYVTVAILLAVISVGVFAWVIQLREGLGVTGLNRPIYWGFYITNFVFFIGISHAGTLISAILRLAKAEWRRAITRSAEVITVLVLFFGVLNIINDLGRPDRLLYTIFHAEFQSPLLWDVVSISTYLICSSVYLFLPLIPDIALMRDKFKGTRRGKVYRILALGWKGTEKQWKILERAISFMAVLIIPIAISVHTVVSYVFAMTIQPMWHSTIFGPYFVTGAIFSGIAGLLIAMVIIRRSCHLQAYLKPVHFNNLGLLLLVMSLLWFYFTFTENLTSFYGAEPSHLAVFYAKLTGPYAPYFWTMVFLCFIFPVAILSNRKSRTISGIFIVSCGVIVGMWLERFTIVLPTLINPRLPIERGTYTPSWVELAITAACFAAFILLYMLFVKAFPIVSIWEIKEGKEVGVEETAERVKSYLPDTVLKRESGGLSANEINSSSRRENDHE
ncbi:MAG: NrfD/PsrC family molybdoenzyme membrane anchor subunit [Candidatus Aminicenantaceae bacterium]